jgi:hypothetical protein
LHASDSSPIFIKSAALSMDTFISVVKIVSKILTLAFAMGGIYFETKNEITHKLNDWGKFMLVGTVLSFALTLVLENQENIDKINSAKAQIDTISVRTKLLLDTTSEHLKTQFDTIQKLSNLLENHIADNQTQVQRQFGYAHDVQRNIRDLVGTTLESTKKVSTLFLQWDFAGRRDSTTKTIAKVPAQPFPKISQGDIDYFKHLKFLPNTLSRTYEKEIEQNRQLFYSFLRDLIHSIPADDSSQLGDDQPDDIFGLVSFGNDYSVVIPFGNIAAQTTYTRHRKDFPSIEDSDVIANASSFPQLVRETNRLSTIDWYINAELFDKIVNFADSKPDLPYLLPGVIKVLLVYNIYDFPFEPYNLTQLPAVKRYPRDWYDLRTGWKNMPLWKKPFVRSQFSVCPGGDPEKCISYEMTDAVKGAYYIRDDPYYNVCDYVVFTFQQAEKNAENRRPSSR